MIKDGNCHKSCFQCCYDAYPTRCTEWATAGKCQTDRATRIRCPHTCGACREHLASTLPYRCGKLKQPANLVGPTQIDAVFENIESGSLRKLLRRPEVNVTVLSRPPEPWVAYIENLLPPQWCDDLVKAN